MGDLNQYIVDNYAQKAEELRKEKEARGEKLTEISARIFDAINAVEVSGTDEDITKLEVLMNVKKLLDNYDRDLEILMKKQPGKFERPEMPPEQDEIMNKISDALAESMLEYHDTHKGDVDGFAIYSNIRLFLDNYDRDLEVLAQSQNQTR